MTFFLLIFEGKIKCLPDFLFDIDNQFLDKYFN